MVREDCDNGGLDRHLVMHQDMGGSSLPLCHWEDRSYDWPKRLLIASSPDTGSTMSVSGLCSSIGTIECGIVSWGDGCKLRAQVRRHVADPLLLRSRPEASYTERPCQRCRARRRQPSGCDVDPRRGGLRRGGAGRRRSTGPSRRSKRTLARSRCAPSGQFARFPSGTSSTGLQRPSEAEPRPQGSYAVL